MIEPVTMIVDTPAWGVTAGVMNPSGTHEHEQEQQRHRRCWLQAAARHANVTAKITNGLVARPMTTNIHEDWSSRGLPSCLFTLLPHRA
ncbi:unnamed protein product [Ectocarpus sp. CCAP 1310/34]|nr:unnamed protein product [Ectocarpus sp. CCAP 1310/34]